MELTLGLFTAQPSDSLSRDIKRSLSTFCSNSYKVSLSELTELHVIRYEVEKDLLPLVLSNCQYSLERGKETLSEYDLPKIQQQVLTRFLQGKPLITLTVSPGF